MSVLFQGFKINNLALKNRFMRSATWMGMADAEGNCTREEREILAQLAKGEVGLVTTGHIAVTPMGRAGAKQLTLYRDKQVAGFKDMVKAVHDNDARVMAQLSHAGLFAPQHIIGEMPCAPSATDAYPGCHVLNEMEIDGITNSFAQAAYRAAEAGFDAIQLHCAHGYLFSQFLSPLFNLRTDQYGGDVENRTRIIVETIRKIRKSIGNACELTIKLNSSDRTEGGATIRDMLEVAVRLQLEGISALEVSGGMFIKAESIPSVTAIKPYEDEAYFKSEAEILRQALDIPLILVGGLRAFETIDKIINDKVADIAAISRPLIREPNLVKRWQTGDLEPASCVSCNGCSGMGLRGLGVFCTLDKRQPEAFD